MRDNLKESFYCPKWEEPIKVGDTIRRIKQGTVLVPVGVEVIVDDICNGVVFFKSPSGVEYQSFIENWEKVPMSDKCKCLTTECAKSILEAQGFTVTPPKGGKVVIFTMGYGKLYATLKEYWDVGNKNGAQIVAIVPWTEGDGL